MSKIVKIGGASGFWGESAMATPQFLKAGGVDYLVYDYLAEITMSIMARAKARNPDAGFATDFVEAVIKPHIQTIAKSGVKILANAGGVNPESCGRIVREIIKAHKLDLKVAIITGDDLMDQTAEIAATGPKDMFSRAPFPPLDKVFSNNAYLGAFPVAKALAAGADIVITGRCVDSAVTLGALIHEFGWESEDWDKLASGSLCGHILECGPQVTGGNFTDWMDVPDTENIGYPIAEVSEDGSFITTKPDNTGGVVNVGTVSEQMLYEIGDPQSYYLPDVICDFSEVTITQQGTNRVHVSPAIGRPAPSTYKTCLTYADGFRSGTYCTFYGGNSTAKARKFADAVVDRAQRNLRASNLGDFTEISTEIIGGGSQMGRTVKSSEVVLKLAVKHPEARACGMFLKESAGMGLATPPGLSGFTGVRGKPSQVVRLFSYLTPKNRVTAKIDMDGRIIEHKDQASAQPDQTPQEHATPPKPEDATIEVPLESIVWARSGDKGDKSNVGLICRDAAYLPYLWHGISSDDVRDTLGHFQVKGARIDKFLLPGSNSINFLIDQALGGGGAASLRNDSQGKGYGQIVLSRTIKVSPEIAKQVR